MNANVNAYQNRGVTKQESEDGNMFQLVIRIRDIGSRLSVVDPISRL